MHGFQLWANLPSSLKMTAPRYQEVKAPDIPVLKDDDGTEVRIVCGSFWGKRGPVDGIAADPMYLDVMVPPGLRKTLPIETTRQAFAYVFGGAGKFCNASGPLAVPTEGTGWWGHTPPAEVDNRRSYFSIKAMSLQFRRAKRGYDSYWYPESRCGSPWRGTAPIVMNTQEQLRQAFEELDRGTFLKK